MTAAAAGATDGLLKLGVGVALACTVGCVPLVTPPLKADLGYASRLGGDSGYRFSGGVSVASVVPDPYFPLDVGAGYVQTETKYGSDHVAVRGVYLEGGPRLYGASYFRAFAGPRLEYYFDPQGSQTSFAGLGRFEVELFHAFTAEPAAASSDDSTWLGVVLGTIAIGGYLEAGYQRLPNEAAYPLLGGGILARIPMTAGVVCCAWGAISPKK